jgi:hypothetical protein
MMRILPLPLLLLVFVALFTTARLPQAVPVANAGPDRTAFTNEVITLDGSASTGAYDGLRPDSDQYSISWSFGYGNWTYQSNLRGPVAYPKAGVYTATLTVCNVAGTCDTDSTQIIVSDIPEGTVTTVSDTGNATTNGTNLCNAITARAGETNPVIQVVAGVTYRMNCTLPTGAARTGSGYMTIRTTGYASLPSGTTRVSTIDPNFATFETAINAAIVTTPATSSTPTHHFRFLGIHWQKADPTVGFIGRAFLDIGHGDETALNQLPHHFIVDRCYFDGGSTTSNTLRGIAIEGSDISVVNSYIYRFKGVALETQGIFIGQGERIGVLNNYVSAASECMLMGGADPRITGHVPTDVVVRRNLMEKDLGWCAFCGSYYGVDFSVKNLWEVKIGLRISNQGNFYRIHWQEDQNWAIVVTVRNQDGTAPWSKISYLDFSYNKVNRVGGGSQWLGNDNLNTSQSIDHILFRHVVFSGISYYNGQQNTFTITQQPGGTPDHLFIVRTSSDSNGVDGQGRWIEFDTSTGFTNCIFVGNVAQGYINAAGFTGDAGMQHACSTSSYSVVKNGFYLPTGTNPTGNTTVATRADVKFTDVANFDLSLRSDSPFLTTGLGSGREGADVGAVDTMTVGCVTGLWPDGGTVTISGKVTLGGRVGP